MDDGAGLRRDWRDERQATPINPASSMMMGRRLIYAEFFGLRGLPFSLISDPDFLFWSANHAKAYAMLEYGLATFAPITVITGKVGAGKTTLVRHLLRQAPESLRIALVSNAHARRGALLQWVMAALGQDVQPRGSYVQRFSLFVDFLRTQRDTGRHTLLIFDEAQNLSERMLEELRCFVNLNNEQDDLLQIVLVGQPELARVIGQPRLLQFAQRISVQFHLTGVPADAVGQYIAHRLSVAGTDQEIFSADACALIARASGGLPRVINQICDFALVYAFADGVRTVTPEIVRQVMRDRNVQSLGQKAFPAASPDRSRPFAP